MEIETERMMKKMKRMKMKTIKENAIIVGKMEESS
jgi:hypothetical protein